MKVLMLFGLIGLSLAVEWTPELMAQTLNEMPLKNYIDFLESDLQKLITKRQDPGEGQSVQHWCCKVDNGEPQPIHKSQNVVLYEKVSIQVKTGYEGCGLWGMGRCEISTARYHQEVRYGQQYMISPLFRDCPSNHVVCCAQYHKVNGNCVHNTHLNKHVGTFEFLHGIGLIKPDDHSSNRK